MTAIDLDVLLNVHERMKHLDVCIPVFGLSVLWGACMEGSTRNTIFDI
jgi:hypothetical protein